jgi:hypothetical protein
MLFLTEVGGRDLDELNPCHDPDPTPCSAELPQIEVKCRLQRSKTYTPLHSGCVAVISPVEQHDDPSATSSVFRL